MFLCAAPFRITRNAQSCCQHRPRFPTFALNACGYRDCSQWPLAAAQQVSIGELDARRVASEVAAFSCLTTFQYNLSSCCRSVFTCVYAIATHAHVTPVTLSVTNTASLFNHLHGVEGRYNFFFPREILHTSSFQRAHPVARFIHRTHTKVDGALAAYYIQYIS